MSGSHLEHRIYFLGDMEPLLQKEAYRLFLEESHINMEVQSEVIELRSMEREVVTKFFWENLSVEEIAKNMKLSKKSIEKLLELALKTIRTGLVESKSI